MRPKKKTVRARATHQHFHSAGPACQHPPSKTPAQTPTSLIVSCLTNASPFLVAGDPTKRSKRCRQLKSQQQARAGPIFSAPDGSLEWSFLGESCRGSAHDDGGHVRHVGPQQSQTTLPVCRFSLLAKFANAILAKLTPTASRSAVLLCLVNDNGSINLQRV